MNVYTTHGPFIFHDQFDAYKAEKFGTHETLTVQADEHVDYSPIPTLIKDPNFIRSLGEARIPTKDDALCNHDFRALYDETPEDEREALVERELIEMYEDELRRGAIFHLETREIHNHLREATDTRIVKYELSNGVSFLISNTVDPDDHKLYADMVKQAGQASELDEAPKLTRQ